MTDSNDDTPNSSTTQPSELERARTYFKYDYAYYNMGFAAPEWLKLEGHELDEFCVHEPESASQGDALRRLVEVKAKQVFHDIEGEVRGFLSSHYMSGYTPKLSHQFMRAYLTWLVNRAAADATYAGLDVDAAIAEARSEGAKLLRELLESKAARHEVMKRIVELAERKWPAHGPDKSLRTYEGMFPLIEMPQMAKLWDQDWAFAYLTVAGCAPTKLESISLLPDNFPLTQELYAKVMGPDADLVSDLANKRLFLLDFALFEGYSGAVTYGQQKYIYAPMALFAWRETSDSQGFGLTPVAIQCGQQPGEDFPIFTPLDGWRWKMARFCVQVAVGTYRGAVLHFGGLHLITDRICIALKRSLSPSHPLYLPLARTFFATLAVNQTTQSFTYENGFSTDLFAPPIEASTRLMLDGAESFAFGDWCPPRVFERRGVADPEVLPIYPFRDDTTLLWGAIESFARDYVSHYYSADEAVAGDDELQAWVRELQAPEGGRLRGVGNRGKVQTVDELVTLLAQVMYHSSGFHSAINYTGFEVFSFPPAMCFAGFAPPPTLTTPDTEEAFLAFLPPMDYAWTQFLLNYDQVSIWDNNIASFPEAWSEDAAVGAIAERFCKQLAQVQESIDAANAKRPHPYPYQAPAWVTASVEC